MSKNKYQEAMHEAVLTSSPIAITTFDLAGRITSWNPAAEALFGYFQDEAIGQSIVDLLSQKAESHAMVIDPAKMIEEHGRIWLTAKQLRKDLPPIDVELIGVPVKIEGETVGYLAMYSDTSKIQEINEELRSQKEYFEALFENSPVAVVTANLDGIIVSWNPIAEKLFGYAPEEVIGVHLDDIVANHPSIREEGLRNTQQVLNLGRAQMITSRTRKDGALVDVELLSLPVIVGGVKVGFIAIYHDLTEIKTIERELRQQKAVFEAILENSPVALVNIDLQGKVLYWNKESEQLFGYSVEEAVGQNVDNLVAKDETIREEAIKFTEELFRTGKLHITSKRTRKDGSLVDVEFSALPVTLGDEIIGFAGAYHDIGQLLEARLQAEAANQAKSEFLARMSHELRTPLNAIIGFTRLVIRKGEQALPEKQLDNLDKVLVSAEHLLGMINDILDISKIEAGRIEVDPSDFEIEPLIDLCISTTMALIHSEKVTLRTELKGPIAPLYSDEKKIKQILLNLLSNSAKFTPQGFIEVTMKQEDESLVLSVIDSGIGIPKNAMERIFEEFQQVDTSTTREYGGTGLGLSISRKLARLLGGNLTASSIAGEGAIFTLTVPMRYQAPEEQRALQD